jgi:hypothetical protein
MTAKLDETNRAVSAEPTQGARRATEAALCSKRT